MHCNNCLWVGKWMISIKNYWYENQGSNNEYPHLVYTCLKFVWRQLFHKRTASLKNFPPKIIRCQIFQTELIFGGFYQTHENWKHILTKVTPNYKMRSHHSSQSPAPILEENNMTCFLTFYPLFGLLNKTLFFFHWLN